MCILELVTILLDLLGLVLISLFLLSVPKPTKFVFNQEFGIIESLQPVADAINEISRNFKLIRRMRIGLGILVGNLLLKLAIWYLGNFSN